MGAIGFNVDVDGSGAGVVVVVGVVEVFVVVVVLTKGCFSHLYRLQVSEFPHVAVVVALAGLRMKMRGSGLCLDQSTRTKMGTHTWRAAGIQRTGGP